MRGDQGPIDWRESWIACKRCLSTIVTGALSSMIAVHRLVLVFCCFLVASCGTYIPSQRAWPNGTDREVADMNATLLRSIVCELSYAVTLTVRNDLSQASRRKNGRAYSEFLESWGVEVATDLSVSENTATGPSGTWTPRAMVSTIFTLSGGIEAGTLARNENRSNFFYPLSDLYKPAVFQLNDRRRPCRDPRGNKEGSPLVDIDLRILPLLESRVQVVQLGSSDAPRPEEVVSGRKNVLSQTVSIRQSISGDITPAWRFTTGALNPSGSFLSAGREQTHQIVFTFGPLADDRRSLTPLAEAFHINEQLRAGIRADR